MRLNDLMRGLKPGAALVAVGGLFGPGALAGQDDEGIREITVEGEVLDLMTGVPVAVAIIAIPSLGRSAITDEWGYFRMEEIPVGTYPLQVMRIGYETLAAEVPLLEGETLALHLTPGPVPLEGIEIRVTDEDDLAWRQSGEMSLSVIGPVEMETLRERYMSVGHILTSRRLPGSRYIPPQRVGGRGCLRLTQESLSLMVTETSACSAVVVDGVLLTPESASYAFDMSSDAIFAMRFVRGSEATIRYGTAGGNGVLVIETRVSR